MNKRNDWLKVEIYIRKLEKEVNGIEIIIEIGERQFLNIKVTDFDLYLLINELRKKS